jgi:hypothetical protein
LGGVDVLSQRGTGYGEEKQEVDERVSEEGGSLCGWLGLFPGEELRCEEDYHRPWLRRVADSSEESVGDRSTVSQVHFGARVFLHWVLICCAFLGRCLWMWFFLALCRVMLLSIWWRIKVFIVDYIGDDPLLRITTIFSCHNTLGTIFIMLARLGGS